MGSEKSGIAPLCRFDIGECVELASGKFGVIHRFEVNKVILQCEGELLVRDPFEPARLVNEEPGPGIYLDGKIIWSATPASMITAFQLMTGVAFATETGIPRPTAMTYKQYLQNIRDQLPPQGLNGRLELVIDPNHRISVRVPVEPQQWRRVHKGITEGVERLKSLLHIRDHVASVRPISRGSTAPGIGY